MSLFFKKIRNTLFLRKRLGNYIFYALGEIVLVVLGILIAVQINEWNNQKINSLKEQQYLIEIIENLKDDENRLKQIIKFNKTKLRSLDSAFHYLSLMQNNKEFGKQFSTQFPILTKTESFKTNNVAYINIISSGNLELLKSNLIRKEISKYYLDYSEINIQNQLKENTQKFLEITVPKMMNSSWTKSVTGKDFNIRSVNNVSIHKDTYVLGQLSILVNKTVEYNWYLETISPRINTLISLLKKELEAK